MANAGVMAVFKNESDLLKAAEAGRTRMNFTKYDAFTPYPVHGLDSAMGIKRSFLPWVTFLAGLAGTLTALALEIGTSAYDWPLNVGGKPFISLPAFIPIVFELTVLLAGLSTVGALFYICGLPNLNPRILHPEITKDKFVLFVPSNDNGYNESKVMEFLRSFSSDVSVVRE